jgi:hypothetical protein
MRLDDLEWTTPVPHLRVWDSCDVTDTIRIYRSNMEHPEGPDHYIFYDNKRQVKVGPYPYFLCPLMAQAILYHLLAQPVTTEVTDDQAA